MIKDENLRFIELVEELKTNGEITNYVQLASCLGTNKAGINDIKSGRKKISVELIRRMKNAYPDINIEWVIMGYGDKFCHTITNRSVEGATPSQSQEAVPAYLLTMLSDKDALIQKQAKEIGKLEQQLAELKQRFEKDVEIANIGNTANAG